MRRKDALDYFLVLIIGIGTVVAILLTVLIFWGLIREDMSSDTNGPASVQEQILDETLIQRKAGGE